MADDKIEIQLELNDKQVSQSLDKIEKQSEKSGMQIGKNIESGLSSFLKGSGTVAVGVLLADIAKRAAATVVNAFSKGIDEAVQSEKALNGFNAALRASGNFSLEASTKFQDYAKSLQDTLGISDDLILANAGILASLGKLSGEGLERATKASLNLAAGLGIDTGTAFDLVAKAAAGNTSVLSRYGIKIDESIPKQERFNALLERINGTFAGLPEAQINTFGGAIARLSVNFNDIFENLGKLVTGSPKAITAINFVSTAFKNISDSIENLGKGGTDPIGQIISKLLQFTQVLTSTVLPTIEAGVKVMITGFNAIKFALFAAAESVATVLLTIINGFVQSWLTTFDLLLIPFEKLGIKMASEARKSIAGFSSSFEQALNENLDPLRAKTEESFTALSESANNAFQFTISDKVNTFVEDLGRAVDATGPALAKVSESTAQVTEVVKINIGKMADLAKLGLNIASGALQRLGASLVQGGAAFGDFTKFALNAIGDFAIQLGQTVIASALAIDALQKSLLSFGGAGLAIAAGIGLIIVGGALKAFAGGPSGVGAGAGGGGGVVAGGSTGQTPEQQPTTELAQTTRGEAQTQVTVNVQGNVLDRRETGLEIVNVFNEFFNTQDGVLAKA